MSQNDPYLGNIPYQPFCPVEQDPQGNGYANQQGNSSAIPLLSNATFSANQVLAQVNPGCRGAFFIWNIASFQAQGSVGANVKIQVVDPLGNKAYIAQGTQRSASGTTALTIYPGITGSAPAKVSKPLPKNFNVVVSLSSGAGVGSAGLTMSLTMWYLK